MLQKESIKLLDQPTSLNIKLLFSTRESQHDRNENGIQVMLLETPLIPGTLMLGTDEKLSITLSSHVLLRWHPSLWLGGLDLGDP